MSNRSTYDQEDTPASKISFVSSHLPPPPIVAVTVKAADEATRSTIERLPTLASAPSSGVNLPIHATPEMHKSPVIASLPPPPPPPRIMQSATIVPPPPPPLPPPPPPPPLPLENSTPTRLSIPPERVDLTTFTAPTHHAFLAKRQTHLSVLILSSEHAQQLAWKNQLHLVDLFQGLVQDLSSVTSSHPLAPFRSVNRALNMHWNSIHIAMVDNMTPINHIQAQELLQHHAQLLPTDGKLEEELNVLEDQVDALLCKDDTTHADIHKSSDMQRSMDRQSRLEQITKDAFALTSPPNIPWLCRFRTALDESTNWVEHDLMAAPAVCLIIVSTFEDNILEAAKALWYSPHYLPQPYTTGVLDPTALRKEVLVLHDAVHGPTDFKEEELLATLKRSFGSGATVLRINSILPSMAHKLEQENTTDVWGGRGKRGNCLSHSDRVSIRRYMAGIITSSLLPALERRIYDLNNIVTERKKGVRNVFKSLFRGAPTNNTSPNSKETSNAAPAKYRYDSIESQVRLLADTLFLVKDFEASLNMYKLIRDDYKQDRSLLHHANIQEMMALCTLLLNDRNNTKEIFGYFETALFSYTRAAEEQKGTTTARPTTAPAATRLATRLCLVMSAAKPTMNIEQHLEVADLLASASSNETSLGAAVLLEQSAAHYFKAGMYRKYAFHTLMSGHMFRSGSQEHHAFRCFTAALYIYQDGQWDELHNHLRSALAAQLYALGRIAASVELYAKLVGTTGGGRVSVKSQHKFVTHLMELCRDHTTKAMVGADRMAAPPRHVRLQRIDQVLQYTPGAKRVLELPSMDMPHIDDDSVTMEVESEANRIGEVIPGLGTIAKGSESVWQELSCHAVAELKAAASSPSEEYEGSSALAKIDDVDIRRVVAEIDKEKTNQNLLARAKRSGSYKDAPSVRARMEPLAVQFEAKNPLAIVIELNEIQLVAQLKDANSRVFTNEDAIEIGTTSNPKSWMFASSKSAFYAPSFCRASPEDGTMDGAWTREDNNPFFVVTKTDLTMPPGSSTRILLSICPLVQGDLEILGVRCKLFNDVWFYHPFQIKGALLHTKSDNHSSRPRVESVLLKAKVEQDMPRLTANLISSRLDTNTHDTALQGQISIWTLQLSNRGSAPATKLTLKTNLPWINVSTKKRSDDEGTSNCLGPSGTLQAIPIPSRYIQPGETVDIPLWIRTTGAALQEFYMLFRYEHADDAKKYRWLQQMISVPIYPSLQIKASMMPSFWAKDEHILSVELTNFKAGNMMLDKICLASREYRLVAMGGQVDCGVTLEPLERVSMHYRLVVATSPSTMCMLSECPLAGTPDSSTPCTATNTVDYLCLESANSRFRAAVRARAMDSSADDDEPRHVSQIRRAKTGLSVLEEEARSHPTSITKLSLLGDSKSMIHLICCWKGEDDVHGQHHVADLLVRPKTSSKGCPMTLTCKHPSHVAHAFSKGPIHIPFEVTVRNRFVEAALEFEFALERQRNFEFMGSECFTWELEGGDELTVPLQAVISSPGCYNLQGVRLTVTKDGKKVPYLFPLQWMVTVSGSETENIIVLPS